MGSSAEAPIDLTFDSDSDNEPGPLQPTSGTSSLTRKTPVLFPGSLPQPSPSSVASQRQGISASAPEFPLASGFPKSENNSPYTTLYDVPANPIAATPSRPSNGPGYVPVFAAATPAGGADDFAIPQAEKRRKISGSPHVSENTKPEPTRRKSIPKPRFYGVKVGHVPGVYTDYDAVKVQILGCKGAKQQRFDTREEAQAFVDGRLGPDPRFAHHREMYGYLAARLFPLASLPSMSPAPTPTDRPSTKPTFVATQPVNGSQSIGNRPPSATAKLSTNGLPSVQFLNTALRRNGTTTPLVGRNEISQSRRELHFGRLAEALASSPATKPAPSGVAIGHSSAPKMVIDQENALPPRQIKHGLPSTGQGTFVENVQETQNHFPETNNFLPEDPLDTLLEDDIISEMLQQVASNDKVALLLQKHPRGQLIARTMQQQSIEVKPTQQPHGQSSLRNTRSLPTQSPTEHDSVLSDSDTPASRDAAHVDHVVRDSSTARRVGATVEQPSAYKNWMGALSEAEAHLLIFLKEVKKLSWPDITAKFQEHYPARKYTTLQTIYSQKINRRDRSRDPATLILPSMYASEAHVEWAEVHANPSRPNNFPKQKRQVLALQEEPKSRARSAAISSLQDHSSGTESPAHHTRPRRGVPVKNYTWPKKNTQIEGGSFEEDALDVVEPAEKRLALSKTPKNLYPLPDKAIAVDNEPLSVDFDKEDAFSALAVQNREAGTGRLPYLSSSQRSDLQNLPRGFEWDQLVSRDWKGTLLHVDFSPVELNLVESTITRLLGPQRGLRSRSQRTRFRKLLHGVTEPKLLHLAGLLRSKLYSRDRRSIDAFLRDAKEDKIRSAAPRIERLAASRPNKSFSSEANLSTSSVIRKRELDIRSNRGWSSATSPISYQLKNKIQDSLGPVCSYTGASSDVHTVAWSVDGECFAAGAICVDDNHSMQYNRSNNLLYGDVSRNIINELGNHYIKRPKTDSGPNSTHAMYASQDPKLFKTVTSVAFSPSGRYMFSGGWDQNVWVWETKYDGSQPTDVVSLHHKSEVSMIAVNASGILATGTRKSAGNAIKVLKLCEDDPTQAPVTLNFSSEKAAARPDLLIRPTALHFSPRYENLLLGGFGANAVQDGRALSGGDICLWDINGNKPLSIWGSGKNVLDLSFHPRERLMAVAAVADQSNNRGMRSTVRVYSELGNAMDDKFSTRMELECRALDINDVVWCPGNDFLVAAGCTSGRTYVWDIRNPNHYLSELAHGSSLMPLDEYEPREVTDTGIRFLSWGNNATRLYSGSSDGVVKVWNVARSEEDTFVKDLITLDSGIMSGAFSPDHSRLLLGEVDGSVNVLEVGRDDCSLKDARRMTYNPYEDDDPEYEMQPSSATAAAESGIASARELIETGQMMIKPMGGLPIKQAVQGPSYTGPYDTSVDAPFLREQALEMQLKFSETPASPCSVCMGPASAPVNITSEEIGDSGRSVDRIPDELRSRFLAGTANLKIPPAKVPCSVCGRAARPSDRVDLFDGTPLPPECEACSFTCLRCGNYVNLSPKLTAYWCRACDLHWEIGALGYELAQDQNHIGGLSRNSERYPGIPKLDGYKKDLYLAKFETGSPTGNDDASFGDEMNALTDYYFSMAIDRPESPPL